MGNSLNIAAIQTLQKIGGPDVLHRVLRELGFSTLDNLPEHYGLGLVLGKAETRLLELATAYATVARMGVCLPLRFLRDGPSASTGKLMERADALPVQLPELRPEFAASAPPAANARDFDEKGRTILGPEYAQWWSAGESALGGLHRMPHPDIHRRARIRFPCPPHQSSCPAQ